MTMDVKITYADGRTVRARRRIWPFLVAGAAWCVLAALLGWPWPTGWPVAVVLAAAPTAWSAVSLRRELRKTQ